MYTLQRGSSPDAELWSEHARGKLFRHNALYNEVFQEDWDRIIMMSVGEIIQPVNVGDLARFDFDARQEE